MSSTIVVPQGFSYVAASVVGTAYLCLWQTFKVGGARRAAKIDYPQVYAEKSEAATSQAAMKFNCTQRAHQNTLETLPLVLTTTIIAGLKTPVVAASLCGGWIFARVLYTVGYSTGIPSKRNTNGGFLSTVAFLGLIGTSSYSAYQLVTAGI